MQVNHRLLEVFYATFRRIAIFYRSIARFFCFVLRSLQVSTDAATSHLGMIVPVFRPFLCCTATFELKQGVNLRFCVDLLAMCLQKIYICIM